MGVARVTPLCLRASSPPPLHAARSTNHADHLILLMLLWVYLNAEKNGRQTPEVVIFGDKLRGEGARCVKETLLVPVKNVTIFVYQQMADWLPKLTRGSPFALVTST